ncbi:MAG: DUF4968 domain-containing protein, partial [Cytophagaceae bacterium]
MFKKYLAGTALLAGAVAAPAQAQQARIERLPQGLLIHLPGATAGQVRTVRLQVVNPHIIHVEASPLDSVSSAQSLMVVNQGQAASSWQFKQKKDEATLRTAALTATVSLRTGAVTFADPQGKVILAEPVGGGKTFRPVQVDGQEFYEVRQAFASPSDEAIYGLGQHQNGVMNYKGQQVDLTQNNTDVAVPFLLSSRNYGILWDNYSITKVGDSRDYEPLSTLRLYSKEGNEGWLTATYVSKSKPGQVVAQRPESVLNYEFLEDQKNFPAGLQLGEVTATWEGSIASETTGTHHFLLKNAGYAQLYIDGKEVVNKWRQAWNPGTSVITLDMVKGRKYALKLAWDPDGSESYLGLKWLSPLVGTAQNEYAFRSEAGRGVNYYFVQGAPDEVISGYRTLTGPAP